MARQKKDVFYRSEEIVFKEYKIESVVRIDSKGQVLLPKDIRERAGIKCDDKLAVASSCRNGKICCIHIFKVEELADTVEYLIGPIMDKAIKK